MVESVHKCMRAHTATELTKSYALNALLKLTVRFQAADVQVREPV